MSSSHQFGIRMAQMGTPLSIENVPSCMSLVVLARVVSAKELLVKSVNLLEMNIFKKADWVLIHA